ncbi:hypothetical protein SPSIL_009260 [Sporomusa silvacetica DSM 10669]|uniref:Uncharacterized protein n=1 Tax=Sporomusa silvacetica DSM 10669 TaxID=1123289 RepID=A0ABZ3IGK0_9FIRM|nr:hypothetical protein [Sporomusa silvacetica]OZC13114.1 hypothetical protein SPSIL_55700 [Sporomusa silvacetica DSM 10669]
MGILKPLIQEIIKWLISSSWLIYNSADQWAQNSGKTALLTVASMATYLVVSILSNLSKLNRPIHVRIKFENLVTRDSFTYYYAKSETNQQQRTVKAEVIITKKSSLWTAIVKKFIKDKECWVNIDALNKGDFILQCNPDLIVAKTEYGLKLDLSILLKEMLSIESANVKQEIEFAIFKSREAGIKSNREIDIIPVCFFDCAKIKFWHKFMYKLEMEPHKVRYFA